MRLPLAELVAGVCVPEADFSALPTGSQQFPVCRQSHRVAKLCLELAQQFPRVHVPYSDGCVIPCGDNILAIRGESDELHTLFMPIQPAQLLARRNVPEADRLVESSRSQHFAVR